MRRFSFLGAVAYLVAALLVIMPLLDVTISLMPFHAGDLIWRFGAIGVLSGGVMMSLLGLFVAIAAAVSLEHRGMVKLTGAVAALACVVYLGFVVMFLLDAMNVRSLIAAEVQEAFGIASVAALFKHVCGVIGAGLVVFAARAEAKTLAAVGGSGTRSHVVSSVSRQKAAQKVTTENG